MSNLTSTEIVRVPFHGTELLTLLRAWRVIDRNNVPYAAHSAVHPPADDDPGHATTDVGREQRHITTQRLGTQPSSHETKRGTGMSKVDQVKQLQAYATELNDSAQQLPGRTADVLRVRSKAAVISQLTTEITRDDQT